MAYDDGFYKAYAAYLVEPTVRKAHDRMFEIAMTDPSFEYVVDFGCGLFNEFFLYAKPSRYIGIDLNVEPLSESGKKLIRSDYRSCKDLSLLTRPGSPTAFVSLFSTEITRPMKENYKLYEKVFKQLPTVNSGLVSGFYYASKKDTNPIGETGGIVSYQTLESPEDVVSDAFVERRMILPVPSKMFGGDVYEVWKFFERRPV